MCTVWAGVVVITALLVGANAVDAAGQGCRTGPCHRDVGRSRIVHAPVDSGDCEECHNRGTGSHPEGAGPEFSLPAAVGELCYGCHDGVRAATAAARSVHEPVRRGVCLECHRAHESSHEVLLRDKGFSDRSLHQPRRMPMDLGNFAICWRCHDKYMAVMPATSSKTGFRDGTRNLHLVHLAGDPGYLCGACHQPHAAAAEMLLGRPMEWTDDLVGFSKEQDGGSCAAGCHGPVSYKRGK